MPYTSPATVVTATTITSAWGNSVKAATDWLANPPHCAARHSVAQSHTTTATWRAVVFDTEDEDTASIHSTSSNTELFTAPAAGLYLVTAGVEFAANATGQRVIGLRKNGTPASGPNVKGRASNPNPGAGSNAVLSFATPIKLAASDTLQLIAFQNSGGALNIGASTTEHHPYFTITWIGLG